MSKQRVYIFGDSFAVTKWHIDYNFEHLPWPLLLAEKYTVENHAVMGTGPDYSIQKLLDTITHTPPEQIKDSVLVFISSDPCRLNLSCYKHPRDQVLLFAIASGDVPHTSAEFARGAVEWMFDHDWVHNNHLKNYSTILHLSTLFKQTLYWNICNSVPTHQQFYPHSKSVQVPKEGLLEISNRDSGNTPLVNPAHDSRPNHLHEPNHQEMYRQLCNWIELEHPIDTEKFAPIHSVREAEPTQRP